MNIPSTLIYLEKPGQILLIKPKSGPCVGRYSSFGGKFDHNAGDKTLLDCAVRESAEEMKLTINPSALFKVGVITFCWEKEIPGFGRANQTETECHIYIARKWFGDIRSTDDMDDPRWFTENDLPWHLMMPGETLWFKPLLANQPFTGKIWYRKGANGAVINVKSQLDTPPKADLLIKP